MSVTRLDVIDRIASSIDSSDDFKRRCNIGDCKDSCNNCISRLILEFERAVRDDERKKMYHSN